MPRADWENGAGGAISGATTGASVGSVIPGIGTAVGGVVGGLIGGISGLFGKKKKKKDKKKTTLDPLQQALYNEYIAGIRGEGPMRDMYNFDSSAYNDVFDQTVGRPAYRNFQENVIPSITGQFRKNGLQNSSYVGDSLSRAGRDVQENLDAQRAANIFSGQQQANQNKQNAINSVLGTQSFAYSKTGAPQPGVIDQILSSLGPAAGQWFADYINKRNSP